MAIKRDIGEKKKPKVVKRGSLWPITPKERQYNPLFRHMRPEDSKRMVGGPARNPKKKGKK